MNEHTLGPFGDALAELRTNVLTMASLAGQNLDHAVRGVLTRDEDLCNNAIAEDEEVNQLEMAIDAAGMEIMMRFQPVAQDLRAVLASMKVANNLERVSDEAKGIAARGRKLLKFPEVEVVPMIEPLYRQAKEMLLDSVKAFSEGSEELALEIGSRDRSLDKAHRKLIKRLTKVMESDGELLKPSLHLIFIVRSLERVGDHSVNMSEDAFFVESARDIRHGGWRDEVDDDIGDLGDED